MAFDWNEDSVQYGIEDTQPHSMDVPVRNNRFEYSPADIIDNENGANNNDATSTDDEGEIRIEETFAIPGKLSHIDSIRFLKSYSHFILKTKLLMMHLQTWTLMRVC